MKLELQFKDYVNAMKSFANKPLSLEKVIEPFGISSSPATSDFLLIGHLLDYLSEDLHPDDAVDAIDIATAAYELGHEEAQNFLDEAPWLMIQMARELDVPTIS